MNKLFLIAGTLTILSLVSCKEKGPQINFSGAKLADSSYTAAVETAQERVVLIEEFTGVSCPPCPGGHTLIYGAGGIKEQHPDQVAVIAYHIKGFPQADPVHDHSKYDFRTDDATSVGQSVFGGIGTLPNAGIDRKTKNNSYLFTTTSWPTEVNADVTVKPPVNVHITSSFDAATRSATVKVTVAYTSAVSKKQALTLAIIENKVVDAQKKELTIIDDYTHNSILRDVITQFYGEPFLDNMATKEAGRVYQRTFKFNTSAEWKPENCQLVAFVHNNEGTDKEVIQAAEVDLK